MNSERMINSEVMDMKNKLLLMCSMLVCMLLIAPGALAATTGTAEVSGNPAASLNLEVSGSHVLGDGGNMALGSNVNETNGINTTVESNTPWFVRVRDDLSVDSKPTGTEGKMVNWTGTGYGGVNVLATPFNVGATDVPYFALTGTNHDLFSGNTAGTFTNYPWSEQIIVVADQRLTDGNTYRIVVTFDATTT